MNKLILKNLKKVCEERFEELGPCITATTLKQFKAGMFWSKDLEKLIADEDVVISEQKMAEIYFEELKESDNLEDYKENLKSLFDMEWGEDEIYIPINILEYNL